MKNKLVIVALISNYALFGIMLNSVGVVILQSINTFLVTKESASLLEGFKDLPIALVSFVVASYLPRIGYARALTGAFALVGGFCFLMPLASSFLATKLLFLVVGASFAFVKISVYSVIGLVTRNVREHASLMNFVEGGFAVGMIAGYTLFSHFIDQQHPESLSWLNVYWVLGVACFINVGLNLSIKIDVPEDYVSQKTLSQDFIAMLKLCALPLVITFVGCAFFYVLIEQSIQTWLPTFNNEVLSIPSHISVQVTAIFAASIAAGRLSASYISKKIDWLPLIIFCLVGAMSIVLVSLPMASSAEIPANVSVFNLPFVAYLLPMIGLFLAPIYPILNSVVLSSLPKNLHSPMTGLIVLFSALGGTTGSMITGRVFAKFSGEHAFYLSIVPMVVIIGLLLLLKSIVDSQRVKEAEAI